MNWCVLTHGPCRGKMCDFWARVRLNKMSIDEIQAAVESWLEMHSKDHCEDLDAMFEQCWSALGLRDLNRLQREDATLFSKIVCVEDRVRHAQHGGPR